MICLYCQSAGKKSTVRRVSDNWNEADEYFDEDGNDHYHLGLVIKYQCSNGHTFDKREPVKCPTCNREMALVLPPEV